MAKIIFGPMAVPFLEEVLTSSLVLIFPAYTREHFLANKREIFPGYHSEYILDNLENITWIRYDISCLTQDISCIT